MLNKDKLVKILLIIAAIMLPIYLAFNYCAQAEGDFLFICIAKVTILTLAYPLLIAFTNRKFLNPPLKLFVLFGVCILIANLIEQFFIWLAIHHFDLLEPWLKRLNVDNTGMLQILHYLINVSFLAAYYSRLLPSRFTNIIRWSSIFLIVAMLVNFLFIEGYQGMGIFNPVASSLYCISLSALHLWNLSKTTFNFPLSKNPYFWISFGLLFSFLIGLFLIITGDFLLENHYDLFVRLSITRNGIEILSNIFLAIGFWNAQYAAYLPLPYEIKKT